MNDEPRDEDLARILREATHEIKSLHEQLRYARARTGVLDLVERLMSTGGLSGALTPNGSYMLERLATHYERKAEQAQAERAANREAQLRDEERIKVMAAASPAPVAEYMCASKEFLNGGTLGVLRIKPEVRHVVEEERVNGPQMRPVAEEEAGLD